MNHRDRWVMRISTLLVGGTGLVYGLMRYLMKPADEFAIVNHPWQPHLQHLHILVAPLMVLVLGHLFIHHAIVYWRGGVKEGRRSGLTMLLSCLPMVFSGYLIQVVLSSAWRTVWIVVHCATSILWLAMYGAHWWSHFRGTSPVPLPAES